MVCRRNEIPKYLRNPRIRNLIINLDNDGPGSHWVYYSPVYKMYFDSYAQLPPSEIPKGTKIASTKKELQSIEATDCGALSVLFGYYLNNRTPRSFYHIFKDVY